MSTFLQTRGLLAKLLATENLVVEHDHNAKTASFDTENRLLKLPVLNTDNENVYNMFCAHEVGHALQTPMYWKNDVPDNIPFDFINVVEDVRIEKYIQNKFPGLRGDFTKGYDYLNAEDFFALRGTDISKLSLIDRINLHFKLGVRALVPFTDEEMVYVKAVDEADTWDKVLLVSAMLSDYTNTNNEDTTEDITEPESGESDEESEESEETQSSGQNGEQNSDSEPGDDIDEDSELVDESVSQTQRSFDESLKEMTHKENYLQRDYIYTSVGNIDLEELTVSVQQVRDTMQFPIDLDFAYDERERMNEFLRSIKGDVNHMVQQFEMKKSANSYARQQTHKTGVLDTNKLHNYRLSDDIFLRQSITPQGKCHGMVMYLDWSGSMSDICFETVKQIITLVQFCRKVQIPFEVYLFTTGDSLRARSDELELDKTLSHHSARIIQVVTSTAKKKQLEEDIWHLWCGAKTCGFSRMSQYLPVSPYYTMGGTPLNNALILVPELIKQFRQRTGAQKVSFVCITDGESSPLVTYEKKTSYDGTEYVTGRYTHYETVMLRSGHTVFPIQGRSTGDCVSWLKSQLTDVSISNIFLGKNAKSKNHLMTYGVELNESVFRKTGSYVTTSDSWPIIGVLNPNNFSDTTDEIEVEAGETKAKIKSALNKMLKTKSSSRMILTELVGQFA